MTNPIPSYLFHIPHMGEVIDYEQLQKKMNARHPPELIHVLDANTHKPLGSMNPRIALIKFK